MTDTTSDVDAELLALIAEATCRRVTANPCDLTGADKHPDCVFDALKSHPELMRRFIGMEQVGWLSMRTSSGTRLHGLFPGDPEKRQPGDRPVYVAYDDEHCRGCGVELQPWGAAHLPYCPEPLPADATTREDYGVGRTPTT